MRSFAIIALLLATAAMGTSVQQQIATLLETGSKANDAIDAVFDLLNDLVESNEEAQQIADVKNATDEFISVSTISKFQEILALNQNLFAQAKKNRLFFEQELKDTKIYLAWNEGRQAEIQRKSENLLDNQCYSNQLFIRSLKFNQEALDVIKLLKEDVQGYVVNGAAAVEFAQMPQAEIQSIAEKLKIYSNIFNNQEVNSFLALANKDDSDSESESDSDALPNREHKRRGTLPEQLMQVLNDLEASVQEAIENLEANEIAAAWELANWLSSSNAELDYLKVEHDRKATYADRSATQIQAALAQQAKVSAVLQESQDALDQAISDYENKQDAYAEAKNKRDEENVILQQVIHMFKDQVSSWSGRKY